MSLGMLRTLTRWPHYKPRTLHLLFGNMQYLAKT